MAENTDDVPYSTISNWVFTWEKYDARCVNTEALETLFESVNDELTGDNKPGLSEDDKASVVNAVNAVLRNAELFTISDFIAVLEPSQNAFHELMSALYKSQTTAIRTDHNNMQKKFVSLEVQIRNSQKRTPTPGT